MQDENLNKNLLIHFFAIFKESSYLYIISHVDLKKSKGNDLGKELSIYYLQFSKSLRHHRVFVVLVLKRKHKGW